MFWLPPKSIEVKFDVNSLCEILLEQDLDETKHPGIIESIRQQTRGEKYWSTGTTEERLAHLKRGLLKYYHPDRYCKYDDQIMSQMFMELTKSINKEVTALEDDKAGDEPEFPEVNQFSARFNRKSTVSTRTNVAPIRVEVTLAQLYKQDEVFVPDLFTTIKCTGDLYDNCHKIIEGRQVIVSVKPDSQMKKIDLDLVIIVPTNPLQLLYATHTVTLPDGRELHVKPSDALMREGLGFKGNDGFGNLILEYKVAKMPKLSADFQKRLHALNMELFYSQKGV